MAPKPEQVSEEEIDGLYAAPLAEFTPNRDELAKRLRSDGEREEADRIKSLRKPSVPAGAINLAVRDEPGAARALLAAGEALRDANQAAMGGAGADELRTAMGEEAAAVEAVARVADEAAGGLNAAMLDRVRDTLRALAGDDELRAEFEAGRVERDRKPVGLGAGMVPGPAQGKRRGRSRGPTAAQRKRADGRVSNARAALDASRACLAKAEEELNDARGAVKEAERDVRAAEGDRERAENELEAAEAAQAELEAS